MLDDFQNGHSLCTDKRWSHRLNYDKLLTISLIDIKILSTMKRVFIRAKTVLCVCVQLIGRQHMVTARFSAR